MGAVAHLVGIMRGSVKQEKLFQQTASLSSHFWLGWLHSTRKTESQWKQHTTSNTLFQRHQEKAQQDDHRVPPRREIQTFPP